MSFLKAIFKFLAAVVLSWIGYAVAVVAGLFIVVVGNSLTSGSCVAYGGLLENFPKYGNLCHSELDLFHLLYQAAIVYGLAAYVLIITPSYVSPGLGGRLLSVLFLGWFLLQMLLNPVMYLLGTSQEIIDFFKVDMARYIVQVIGALYAYKSAYGFSWLGKGAQSIQEPIVEES